MSELPNIPFVRLSKTIHKPGLAAIAVKEGIATHAQKEEIERQKRREQARVNRIASQIGPENGSTVRAIGS